MPTWTTDGGIVFASNRTGRGRAQLFLIDEGAEPVQFTQDPGRATEPAWSRDGRLAFTSNRDGNNEVYVLTGGRSPGGRR